MKRAEIADLVRQCVREFGMTPKEINDGRCDEFADLLVSKFKGFTRQWSSDSDDFNHDWVSYRGLHYDAETPEGVSREEIGTKPEYRHTKEPTK
jgi:hypothetical protein